MFGFSFWADVCRGSFETLPPFVCRNGVKETFHPPARTVSGEISVENYSKVPLRQERWGFSGGKPGWMETRYLWGDLMAWLCLKTRRRMWSSTWWKLDPHWTMHTKHNVHQMVWWLLFIFCLCRSSLWLGGGLHCRRSEILHQVRGIPLMIMDRLIFRVLTNKTSSGPRPQYFIGLHNIRNNAGQLVLYISGANSQRNL